MATGQPQPVNAGRLAFFVQRVKTTRMVRFFVLLAAV